MTAGFPNVADFLNGIGFLNGAGFPNSVDFLNGTGLPDGTELLNRAASLNGNSIPYGFNFLHWGELLLLLPLAFFLVMGFRKKINKKHLFFHALVGFLLIIALAAPYSAEMVSLKSDHSRITILSDESAGMELLRQGVSEKISENLSGLVPVTLTTISGENTPLGDAILQQASSENYVLVISDGQSNSGTSIEDALSFCSKNGFPVGALVPETLEEELSVEIEGPNEVSVDTEAFFKVHIRKSTENKMTYRVRVTLDLVKILEREISPTERTVSLDFNHSFDSLGPHTLKATLHPENVQPEGLDDFKNNNQFMKSVYVTPKPKVLFVSDEPESPLADILYEVYDVQKTSSGNSAGPYAVLEKEDSLIDAVIIDNQQVSAIPAAGVETLRKFVLNGGGLVVVGGDSSFDYPVEQSYQDTEFEALLPVTSRPSNWRGGRNIVLMLDVSPSTLQENGIGGRILDDILSNAIVLLESDLLKDASVDVITFGSKGQDISEGFLDMSREANRQWLDARINETKPSGDSTSLEQGLLTASRLLEAQDDGTGAGAEIVVISDGGIGDPYLGEGRVERAVERADGLKEKGIGIYFAHIHSPKTESQVTKEGQYYAETFMRSIGLYEKYERVEPGQRLKLSYSEEEKDSETLDNYSSGSVVIYNPKHFITRDVSEISNEVLGYNEVTPRPEANRLVITRLGKPLITVRRLGLGRVAAITTDNGNGHGIPWAPALYSGKDSLVITNTLNWAVADTETAEDIRLKVPDLKVNQPGRILITARKKGTPELSFDRTPLEITSIGKNMYEAYVTPQKLGINYISERRVAVNQPDEYVYIGENPNFKTAILENGGKIYTQADIYSRIINDSRTTTEKPVRVEVVYTKQLLGLAFLVYLLYTLVHTFNMKMK